MSGNSFILRPSKFRRVILNARGNSYSRVSTNSTRLYWPPVNPLDWKWSWIDASRWCEDIGDVVGQIGWQIIGGDGKLSVTDQSIARQCPYNACWAGIRTRFGTVGTTYLLRIRLTGQNSGEQSSSDIWLRVVASGPVENSDVTQATINGDSLIVGGIPIFVS